VILLLGCGGREKKQVVGWLLLMCDGKWAVSLLERDVATGMWRGETVQVVLWLFLVWDGKWAVSLL